MKAVERFDPNKGSKFSTYAAWGIKQSMKRAIANQGRNIRLPVHIVDKITKIRRLAFELSKDLGREPTAEEISDETGIPTGALEKIIETGMHPLSLDALLADHGSGDGESDRSMGREFELEIPDEKNESPLEREITLDMQRKIKDLLSYLDPRRRQIIIARFGLDGLEPRTLDQVGTEIKITRERVRQLESQGLRIMYRRLNRLEDPDLQAARNMKPAASTPQGVADRPMNIILEEKDRTTVLTQLEAVKDQYPTPTLARAKILAEKLILHPGLTPRRFEDTLSEEELRVFSVHDIRSLVMPSGNVFFCLKNTIKI